MESIRLQKVLALLVLLPFGIAFAHHQLNNSFQLAIERVEFQKVARRTPTTGRYGRSRVPSLNEDIWTLSVFVSPEGYAPSWWPGVDERMTFSEVVFTDKDGRRRTHPFFLNHIASSPSTPTFTIVADCCIPRGMTFPKDTVTATVTLSGYESICFAAPLPGSPTQTVDTSVPSTTPRIKIIWRRDQLGVTQSGRN